MRGLSSWECGAAQVAHRLSALREAAKPNGRTRDLRSDGSADHRALGRDLGGAELVVARRPRHFVVIVLKRDVRPRGEASVKPDVAPDVGRSLRASAKQSSDHEGRATDGVEHWRKLRSKVAAEVADALTADLDAESVGVVAVFALPDDCDRSSNAVAVFTRRTNEPGERGGVTRLASDKISRRLPIEPQTTLDPGRWNVCIWKGWRASLPWPPHAATIKPEIGGDQLPAPGTGIASRAATSAAAPIVGDPSAALVDAAKVDGGERASSSSEARIGPWRASASRGGILPG